MKIHKEMSGKHIDDIVASYLSKKIKANPTINLGLATGSTYIPLYQTLVAQIKAQDIDVSKLKTFNLDCYADQNPADESSFQSFMNRHLFHPLNILPHQVHFPEYLGVSDYGKYDDLIDRAGGLDIVLLGIGVNAHIAFNEPGTPFSSKTHKVLLAEETIESNEVFFKDKKIPKEGITMGISTVLSARQIILVAKGESKANAIYDMMYAGVSVEVPATALRNHPNVDVYVDPAAGYHL
jgi:glucosamine-6-phosphate deaminase